MRKLWFLLLMAALVLLAACSSSTGTPMSAAATPTQPVKTAAPTRDTSAPEMTCRVVSMIPTPGPTEVSLFAPAGEQDWILGNEDALLTITEYSDFQ
jgi:ABC-type Fe3+-hydroxamate transport system substrate-binding protein